MSEENKPGFDGPDYNEYLGDGVYVAWRNGATEISVGEHTAEPCVVFEPEVLNRLKQWHNHLLEVLP
jgi:hypothetical protein